MSNLEYHVLLALAGEPLYGLAIRDAVAAESAGALLPRAGSLYRVIARLMADGLVREVAAAPHPSPNPGLPRRYYALTPAARRELLAETRRRKQAVALAEERLGVAPGRL